jgi:hypothetical protein
MTHNKSKELLNLLWINIVFKILDIFTTTYSVNQNGTTAEFNPILRSIIDKIGFYPTMSIVALAHCGLVYFLYRKAKVKLLKIVGVLTLIFVIINIIDILIPYLT